MSDTKKYYWLKLKRDFFKRHDIKIIESMENGKDYVLFYLKLLLESVDHDGSLRFSETVPYNDKMLATITDTNIDIVRSAVKIFAELGMMEQFDDGTLYMAQVQSMLGSETSEAIRLREIRAKKKQMLITQGESVQRTKTYEKRTPEIELEIELDKEIDKDNKETPDKPATQKHKYGEYYQVLLTDQEYLKLSEEWGEPELLRMIKTLDEGIEAKGYKYKNHYLALRKWKEKDRGTPIPKQKQEKKTCPVCGKELSGLFCKPCMIQYNEKMEETL
jgi:predicted phage replisome organizer